MRNTRTKELIVSYDPEKINHTLKNFLVRMRAKEVIELLGDSEKIQTERQKAKENKTKYTGVSSSSTSSGIAGRFGGFGNSSFTSKSLCRY